MSYNCIVKQGNLLDEENATFIVNASNTVLQLGSGVSAAFSRRCGMKLRMEMHKKLSTLSYPLQKGDVVATSSGDASNFKYALHAAVMDYNQGVRDSNKLPTLDDIQTTLENIELYIIWYFNNHKDDTIKLVLPLLGCGVGGLDKYDVLETYKAYFKKSVVFDCEVVVYAYSDADYQKANACLREMDRRK